MRRLIVILTLALAALAPNRADAFSLSLDSIAEMGRFPKFCVDVYRWGDRTFNSYDSLYVKGPGTKFNVKIKTDSWMDYYRFELPDNHSMSLRSDPSTSLGVWLTYLAVSVGYDKNVSEYLGKSGGRSRDRWDFQFNCALFSAEFYWSKADVGTHITRLGIDGDHFTLDDPFRGITNRQWGIETYYFFNHKRYSQAAAFHYSKLQQRSQGSFYAGISITGSTTDFDFTELTDKYQLPLPENWRKNGYHTSYKDYSFRLGYGYNWVPHRKWTVAISLSPVVGVRRGYTSESPEVKSSFGLTGRGRASVVFNSGRWFAGIVGRGNVYLVRDKSTSLISSTFSGEISVGYRFNIW